MIHFILEILFELCCGWVGHWTVKLLTFGKVDLHDHCDEDSRIPELVGAIVLLLLIIVIAVLIRHT